MRGRTAKLLRTYCGLRAGEGAPVVWRDMKKRFSAIPRPRRGAVLDAMAAYIRESGRKDFGAMRRGAGKLIVKEGRSKSGILSMLAALFGVNRGEA